MNHGKVPDSIFKELSPEDVQTAIRWVRSNYDPDVIINEVWHPVVREEWRKITERYLAGKYPNDEDIKLWMFSGDHGKVRIYFWQYEPSGLGHFEKALMEAICKADEFNLAKLRKGYPETVKAYGLWKHRRP